MKAHWTHYHPGMRGKRGRGAKKAQSLGRPVQCQRFFIQGHGSNFFRVEVPPPSGGSGGEIDELQQAVQQAIGRYHQIDEQARRVIREREEGTEFVPWVETMHWQEYLGGLDREELMELVQTPDEDEPLVAIIWEAMDGMIRYCQYTSTKHAGDTIKIGIVRTEATRIKTQRPLQPYMDRDSIGDHARPWKQMIAFLVRTRQRRHERPEYRFRDDENVYFDTIIREAWHVDRARTKGGRNDSSDKESRSGSEADSETGESTEDNSEGEENGSRRRGDRSDQASTDDEDRDRDRDPNEPPPVRLRGLKVKCLRFCIALLRRRMMAREYEVPLVCAMVLLAVTPQGWMDQYQYPPVISRVIKVARFMVIQSALQRAEEELA